MYSELNKIGIKTNLVSYFEDVGENYNWLVNLPVEKISLDFVYGNNLKLLKQHGFPKDKILGAGVVDGRSVFQDSKTAYDNLEEIKKANVGLIEVGSSCSLQHCPYDLQYEVKLSNEHKSYLSFSIQKLQDIVNVANGINVKDVPDREKTNIEETLNKSMFDRPEPFNVRRKKQPQMRAFPTTQIGSLPQTKELRKARAD